MLSAIRRANKCKIDYIYNAFCNSPRIWASAGGGAPVPIFPWSERVTERYPRWVKTIPIYNRKCEFGCWGRLGGRWGRQNEQQNIWIIVYSSMCLGQKYENIHIYVRKLICWGKKCKIVYIYCVFCNSERQAVQNSLFLLCFLQSGKQKNAK